MRASRKFHRASSEMSPVKPHLTTYREGTGKPWLVKMAFCTIGDDRPLWLDVLMDADEARELVMRLITVAAEAVVAESDRLNKAKVKGG